MGNEYDPDDYGRRAADYGLTPEGLEVIDYLEGRIAQLERRLRSLVGDQPSLPKTSGPDALRPAQRAYKGPGCTFRCINCGTAYLLPDPEGFFHCQQGCTCRDLVCAEPSIRHLHLLVEWLVAQQPR